MLHYAVMTTILAMTLVGCANKPSKEAPIESLGGHVANAAATPPIAVKKAAVAESASTKNAVVAESASTKKAADEAGRTQPLRADAMQAKPLAAQAASGVGLPVRPKARTFQFDYDSAALVATDHATLEAHGAFLKVQPKLELLVQGHADERGSREYNLALGQRRAESVKQALGLLGVPEVRVEAVSLGSEKPVAEGHDEAAWKQNRRAILIYKDEW